MPTTAPAKSGEPASSRTRSPRPSTISSAVTDVASEPLPIPEP